MADFHIGIDYGTRKVAVAVIDQHFKLRSLDDLVLSQTERYNELRVLSTFVHEVVAPYSHSANAVIESAILGASMNAQTLANLGYTAGALCVTLINQGITSQFVASATWKKEAIGRGNATKEEVMAWATAVWPEAPIKTQDMADALAMAACARDR